MSDESYRGGLGVEYSGKPETCTAMQIKAASVVSDSVVVTVKYHYICKVKRPFHQKIYYILKL